MPLDSKRPSRLPYVNELEQYKRGLLFLTKVVETKSGFRLWWPLVLKRIDNESEGVGQGGPP
jgi:hypothetical protein